MYPELLFVIPIMLILVGFYLNYKVYRIALKVYHKDPLKAGKIHSFRGDRMLREDFLDPFYHNNQKEIAEMIKLRNSSTILITGAIVLVVLLNFK